MSIMFFFCIILAWLRSFIAWEIYYFLSTPAHEKKKRHFKDSEKEEMFIRN